MILLCRISLGEPDSNLIICKHAWRLQMTALFAELSPGKRSEINEFQAASGKIPDVTIVVPVYRNKEIIWELYRRLHHVLETSQILYEMIFVNDACPEDSLTILEKVANIDPQVAVLALEQNVGQHRAVLTGLGFARGKWVVVMDADLQDPPEAIPDLLTKIQEGYSAVFAGRRGLYESPFRLLTSRLFKWLLHLLCNVPKDAGIFVVLNQHMVKRLLTFKETRSFVVAMIGCTGLPTTSIPVVRAQRSNGRSSYSSWKRLKTGCLAIAWVLSWKWNPDHQITRCCVNNVPVKAYIGTRFAFSKESTVDREVKS